MENIEISKYIAHRTYNIGKKDSKTLVLNEKTKQYILLEGITSDFFFYLINNENLKEFLSFNKINNLKEFINELRYMDILASDKVIAKYSDTDIEDIKIVNTVIINNMKKFILENNYLWLVHLNLTYRCNQNCVHCYSNTNSDKKELTTQEVYEFIDNIVTKGAFFLIIHGGEPTIRTDFFEIVEYARNKGLSVELFTNGLNLTTELIEKLKCYWLHNITVSLYGSNDEVHDNITRIVGSFDFTTSAIKTLNKNNINNTIKFRIIKENINDFEYVKDLCKKLGSKLVYD